jgi:hypothetical protein
MLWLGVEDISEAVEAKTVRGLHCA